MSLKWNRKKALDNVYTAGVIFVRFTVCSKMYPYTEFVYIRSMGQSAARTSSSLFVIPT